jgi:hypothetical protein
MCQKLGLLALAEWRALMSRASGFPERRLGLLNARRVRNGDSVKWLGLFASNRR